MKRFATSNISPTKDFSYYSSNILQIWLKKGHTNERKKIKNLNKILETTSENRSEMS
jgi:hypothetical protein